MEKFGYKSLADLYDLVNSNKNYSFEVKFLNEILRDENVRTVLDVGCGTGTHISLLEKLGYICDGVDLNFEMLEVAEKKVKGNLYQGNMIDFSLGQKYDAIICMYAAFNHLIREHEVIYALDNFKTHLNKRGVILLDLHNPQNNGEKENNFSNVKRKLIWEYNPVSKIEKSQIIYEYKGETIKDSHTMRIYSVEEIKNLLEESNFKEVEVYENYSFTQANNKSKNLNVFGRYF